ncbi:MAG: energy-coupling factor transporter transmembrane protein EcfT [Oscillospiraceae bacterium]|nr:energy-coupling factor transporter transmembrane protein EcfT [Oscillospiraceae bacterium]
MIHRLDPRVKLTLVTLFVTALFTARGPLTYALVFIWLAYAVIASRLSLRVFFRGLRPLVFILVFTAILNALYTQGEILFSWWIIKITREGLIMAAYMLARILMLVTGTFLLTYTTSPIMLTDALERVLKPLKKIKVPVHELAMMMTIALRFIPTLIEETQKIMSAQQARGADFESPNLMKRVKAMIPLLVPLFVSAFQRAEDLAVAMECRCYNGGVGRTRMRVLRMGFIDYAALTAAIALCAAVFILR